MKYVLEIKSIKDKSQDCGNREGFSHEIVLTDSETGIEKLHVSEAWCHPEGNYDLDPLHNLLMTFLPLLEKELEENFGHSFD